MKQSNKVLAAIMLMTVVMFVAGCKPEDDPNNGGGNNSGGIGTYNGHEYVDLGLPSGTLWATCNVGATAPEGYGDYFAWGETEPKTYYFWDTYKYCNGSKRQLTKYCSESSYGNNGFTDNLTTLQSVDDAATANWGNDWRMPTFDQWQELSQNTTFIWTTQEGVNGGLFTASNGNTLFLPAAGDCRLDELPSASSNAGRYWSCSLYTDYSGEMHSSDAHVFVFGWGSYETCRYYGRSVRAVRSAR